MASPAPDHSSGGDSGCGNGSGPGMVGSKEKKLIRQRATSENNGRMFAPSSGSGFHLGPLFNSTHLSDCRPIGLPSVSITIEDEKPNSRSAILGGTPPFAAGGTRLSSSAQSAQAK